MFLRILLIITFSVVKVERMKCIDFGETKREPGGLFLSAFCLPSAGLSAAFAGGLGYLLILATEGAEIVHSVAGFIPSKESVVLGADNPSVRVFLENCFPFGI